MILFYPGDDLTTGLLIARQRRTIGEASSRYEVELMCSILRASMVDIRRIRIVENTRLKQKQHRFDK